MNTQDNRQSIVAKALLPLFFVVFVCAHAACQNQLQRSSQKAIHNAITYLEQQPFNFDYVYLYAYLTQNYPKQLRPISHQQHLAEQLDSISKNDLNLGANPMFLFYRLVDSSFHLPSHFLPTHPKTIDEVSICALYCSQTPIDTNYLSILRQQAAIGNYSATHALLALIFLKKQGCLSPQILRSTNQLVLKKCKEQLLPPNDWTDLSVEVIALLQYYQPSKLYRKHLLALLNSQNSDGGWAMRPDTEASHTHTTILAVWALLPLLPRCTQ